MTLCGNLGRNSRLNSKGKINGVMKQKPSKKNGIIVC